MPFALPHHLHHHHHNHPRSLLRIYNLIRTQRATLVLKCIPGACFASLYFRPNSKANTRTQVAKVIYIYIRRPIALAVTADQSAREMSFAGKINAYLFFLAAFFPLLLFLRSRRNIYFTSHRYDLGRAEEPLYSRSFSPSLVLFPLSLPLPTYPAEPRIINNIFA